MKKFFTLFSAALFSLSLMAQGPQTYPGNGNVSPLVNGVVANGSLVLSDDGNYLTVTFNRGTAPMTHELVIYVESYVSGFSSTQNFVDTSTFLRKGVSGFDMDGRATFNFDPSFKPLYAIAFNPRPRSDKAVILQLVQNGNFRSLGNATVANGNDTNAASYTFKVKLGAIGIATSTPVSFKFLATYVNKSFRYQEAVGDPMTPFTEGRNPYTSTTTPLVYNGSALSADNATLDSLALVELYDSTNGTGWTNNSNWRTSSPLSTWYGITTTNGRVTGIDLSDNNLTGQLPRAIYNLDSLDTLNISNNSVSNNVPPVLDSLYNLTYLNFRNNQFVGRIPKIDSLRKLVVCDMGLNRFSDIAPQLLSNLDSLKEFRLDSNRLTIQLPNALSKIPNLEILDFSHNQITGTIPPQLGKLAKLTLLDFGNNQLTGEVPGNLGSLTALTRLGLDSNQFTGSIPPQLGNDSLLTDLYLNYNQFSGEIPEQLNRLIQLDTLYLQFNKLSGTIPESFKKLTKLEFLNVRQNALTGTIPNTFKDLTSLRSINVSYNQLSGTLPASLLTLTNLTKVSIRNNDYTFTGIEDYVNHGFDTLNYAPQGRIPIMADNSGKLSVSAGGTPSNNTYKWYRNNVLVATITGDSTYQPTMSGTYYVKVTNSVATELTLVSKPISVNASPIAQNNTSSAIAKTNKTGVSIYPNPATTTANFSFSLTGNCNVKVTDLSGRVMQIKTVSGSNGSNTMQLDVSRFAAGTYFVTVTNEKNEKQTLQLNKQ